VSSPSAVKPGPADFSSRNESSAALFCRETRERSLRGWEEQTPANAGGVSPHEAAPPPITVADRKGESVSPTVPPTGSIASVDSSLRYP
jgi:hypothetical protein